MTEAAAPDSKKKKREMGLFAGFWLLVGLAIMGVTALSALNVLFDWNLALGSHGSTTPLPRHWDAVGGLGAAGILIIVLSLFGSAVAGKFKDAKGKPMVRVGIIAGALALLVVAGRGVQIIALTSTYGSMLAYYCTDVGSLEDVQGELEGASPEALDSCLGRTAQWDRDDLLAPVIAAGANFKDESSEPQFRSCVLGSDVSLAYVNKAIELGATPDSCANSQTLIYNKIRQARPGSEDELVEVIKVLLKSGWAVKAKDESGEEQDALALAKKEKMDKIVALLEAPSP